ncbi:MAG: bifunctional DNA-formamidopyrimidine glycosylase/DNA-(apurinic or apyrimidinic site) lyase [Gemmatimonadetes bacterium]|nr:bifunctional DNA-formamidopyrimidine glycosylase/DNA-(apurinic or apyrimidinic site) lyase [Gemmatimonadota bacterium]
MPELPEVEEAATRLRAVALRELITMVQVRHPALARSFPPQAQAAVVGETIVAVTRRGKSQRVGLADGGTLEVHFRLAGDWALGRRGDPEPPHERLRIDLAGGARVSLVDPRALSVVRYFPSGTLPPSGLGPEPLEAEFTVPALQEALRTRRVAVKLALLDQRVVAGVGNIYAAEALWEARIHPGAVAGRLTRARVARLHDAIRTVLQTAPAGRYHAPDGVREGWRVYGRAGAPCGRCGAAIGRMVQGGRSSYYCPTCQR